jgi:hypothetical protein
MKPILLSNNTYVSITLLSGIFGFALWMTASYVTSKETRAQVVEIKQQREKDIDRIEYKLEKINAKLDKIQEMLINGNKN